MAYAPASASVILFGGELGLDDTWAFQLLGDAPDEACGSGFDLDGDGAIGCADPDCWPICAPLCAPGGACDPAWPRCGDAACGPVETCRSCEADCGVCAPQCGDFWCEGGETAATCPGDCG